MSERIAAVIRAIPRGRVATYGQIAVLAGAPGAARRVAWLLHSLSQTEQLPWHRVIGSSDRISLPPGGGAELQRSLLEAAGVRFEASGSTWIGFSGGPPPRAAQRQQAGVSAIARMLPTGLTPKTRELTPAARPR